MSENKRFKVKGFDEYDQMVWDTEFEQSCSVEQVVNMLNDKDDAIDILNEENEYLKEQLADANELNSVYVDFLVDKGFELSDVIEWSKKELEE